jgi:hypothetical protein
MLAFFLTEAHFWEFFFAEPGKHWYESAVWGNVMAIVPCGFIAFFWLRSKHLALTETHRLHAEKLDKLLAALDPEEMTDSQLDRIMEALDLETPGGLTQHRDEILAAIHEPHHEPSYRKGSQNAP